MVNYPVYIIYNCITFFGGNFVGIYLKGEKNIQGIVCEIKKKIYSSFLSEIAIIYIYISSKQGVVIKEHIISGGEGKKTKHS